MQKELDEAPQELPAEQVEKVVELYSRAATLSARLSQHAARQASSQEFSIVDGPSVTSAFTRVWLGLAQRPWELLAFQQSVAHSVMSASLKAWASDNDAPPARSADRRFRDREWQSDPLARTMRDAHLALESATAEFLAKLPADSKDQQRVAFYTRQLLSALAPSNFLFTNPAARTRFLETMGQSWLDGLSNLLDDIERGDGRLDITTNDPDAFVVGRDLATTPGKVIFQNDLMQLIQYEPRTEKQRRRPLLMVPPWINKYYILDMRPNNSLVRYMVERGHTVFLISWVNPDARHAAKDFADYMNDGPLAALDVIEKVTGERHVNVLGFCIGGILVTAMLAYLAARDDGDRIASATTLATLVDFTDVGEIGVFIDRDQLESLRQHVARVGYLESYHLQDMFSKLRENDLIWSFHQSNYLMGEKPRPFDLLFWNSDSTRLPAAMLIWYLEKIYLENGLRRPGYLEMNGTPIDISKIRTPCFVFASKEDHIAPWHSVYPATQLFGGPVTFVLGASGHIAGVINPPAAQPKYGYWTGAEYPPEPEAWLQRAQFTKGSWWPFWGEWMEALDSDEFVDARTPGGGVLPPLEDAPGSYVIGPPRALAAAAE